MLNKINNLLIYLELIKIILIYILKFISKSKMKNNQFYEDDYEEGKKKIQQH